MKKENELSAHFKQFRRRLKYQVVLASKYCNTTWNKFITHLTYPNTNVTTCPDLKSVSVEICLHYPAARVNVCQSVLLCSLVKQILLNLGSEDRAHKTVLI